MSLSATAKGIVSVFALSGSVAGIIQLASFPRLESIPQEHSPKVTKIEKKEVNSGREEKKENIVKVAEVLKVPRLETRKIQKEEKKVLSIEKQKELTRKEAKEVFKTLEDYSFKIFGPDCSTGTGWILDYKLPRRKSEYPTTWYIATNAHVIDNFRFSANPYNQSLPWADIEDTKAKRESSPTMLGLLKGLPLNFATPVKCSSPARYGYLDMNLSSGEIQKSNYGMVANKKIEEPRLFFSAFNFLKKREGLPENHYTDFVVLEVKFTSEWEARTVTKNFARKYTVNSTDAINIFAGSLESKYTKDELNNLQENFYLLAYPGITKNKWRPTINFNSESTIASHLVKQVDSHRENSHRGLVYPIDYWDMKWGKKKYEKFGHWILMNHNLLLNGSSGGLFLDKHKNAISVKTGREGPLSVSIPLRSKEFTFWDAGKLIRTPAFDLISGVDGQLKSYRQQVEEYITSNGEETWLSARGWKHIIKDNVDQLRTMRKNSIK